MPHSIRDLLEIVTIFNLPTPISSFLIPLSLSLLISYYQLPN
nr:MAG TPA: hypothetical protein [Caudoviricetes sp.]